MKLKEFQKEVFGYLSGEKKPEELGFVKQSKGIMRNVRLGTYKDSYVNRAIDCIKSDFPVTEMFLGVDSFYEYLEDYLKTYPSKTHYINEISKHLPKYIESNLPQKAKLFVVPMAQMEWLMIESFYNFFNFENPKNKTTPEGETPMQTNPSLVLFESEWPLDKIWNEEKEFDKESSFISIWALEDRIVRVRSWTELEYKTLQALSESVSLEEAIKQLENVGRTEDMEKIFSQTLPEWIQLGLVMPVPTQ